MGLATECKMAWHFGLAICSGEQAHDEGNQRELIMGPIKGTGEDDAEGGVNLSIRGPQEGGCVAQACPNGMRDCVDA